MDLAERFWSKVYFDTTGDGCWLWTAYRDTNGYGHIGRGGRQGTALAHRVSWELTNGSIPRADSYHGICVLHRCDNPPCVRPDHLFLGTQLDNVRDMGQKGRSAKGEAAGSAKLTDAQVKDLRDLYATGDFLQSQLATRFGTSRTNVWFILHGLTRGQFRAPRYARPFNGVTKLTREQVQEVRCLAASGTPRSELARKYAVTVACVGMIVRGERWRP